MRALALLILAVLAAPAVLPAAGAFREEPEVIVSREGGGPAWGNVATARIRPGAEAVTSLGTCTFNFLFHDGAIAYVGTAAHCTESVGDRVATPGVGRFGTVVYDSDRDFDADPLLDFTLVRIDDDKIRLAHPAMFGVHAPTGLALAHDLNQGEALTLHGHGVLVGETEASRLRGGVLVTATQTHYKADLPAVYGDSGAPLVETETGRAVGIISQYGLDLPVPTTDKGPLLRHVLDELARNGYPVSLATV